MGAHSDSVQTQCRMVLAIDERAVRATSFALRMKLVAFLSLALFAQFAAAPPTREAVLAATLQPYTGPSERGVDTSTLTGKVMCGYQGWFACEGDGGGVGNQHWTKRDGALGPGNAKVDLWPDVSELGPDERFATGFQLADGKPAEVFSSYKQATLLRHLQWMREYGIDGALKIIRDFDHVFGETRHGIFPGVFAFFL